MMVIICIVCFLAEKPDIVGLTWCQHVMGSFCLPQLSYCKKRENTAFDLVLEITSERLSPDIVNHGALSGDFRRKCFRRTHGNIISLWSVH